MVLYYRYRCDKQIESTPCSCSLLLENASQTLKSELIRVYETLDTLFISPLNNSDNEEFRKQLTLLKDAIRVLYTEIDVPFNSNQDQISIEINNMRNRIITLIETLMQHNTTSIENVIQNYQFVYKLSEKCEQKLNETASLSNNMHHNEIMTSLSKEAKDVLKDLLGIISLLSNIENSYKNAKQSVQEVSANITSINSTYLESVQNLSATKQLSTTAALRSTQSKENAISNQQSLDNITFKVHNKYNYCNQEIPNYKNNLEHVLTSHFENCYHEQSILDMLSSKLQEVEVTVAQLEKQNENDRALLKAVYEEAKNLIDRLEGRIAIQVINITDLNEENENNLLVLQEELIHLIQKFEMFSYQLLELQTLSNKNSDFLEVSDNSRFRIELMLYFNYRTYRNN